MPKGEELYAVLLKCGIDAEAELVRNMTEEEAAEFNRLLKIALSTVEQQ
jgi:hypothetical protein